MNSESEKQLKQALHDAHRTQSLLDATIKSTASGVVVCDLDINFVLVNPAAEKILGKVAEFGPERWSDSLGLFKSENERLFESHELPLARAIGGEIVDRMELLVRNGVDEEAIWVEANATQILGLDNEPIGAVTVFNDVTLEKRERERLREQQQQVLGRAARLASVGTLAAGIAHEINNPLAAIMLATELGKARMEMGQLSNAQLDDVFTDIKQQVNQCADIVKGVLKFANNDAVERSACSVREIAGKAKKLVKFKARKRKIDIQIRSVVDGPEPLVNVDETEITQVIGSLLSNSIDASPDESVVEIRIRNAGSRVICSVVDSGTGLNPEQEQRVFDPFFTSKRTTGGTGLGLSMSHSIIASHGGEIWIDKTKPGKGTTFCFSLPVTRPARRASE